MGNIRFHFIPALLAILMMVIPPSALPCCAQQVDSQANLHKNTGENKATKSCCSLRNKQIPKKISMTSNDSTQHQEDYQEHGKCNCPPNCPSKCCGSKTPCDPVKITKWIHVQQQTYTVSLSDTDFPVHLSLEKLFRPPRFS